MSIQIRLPIHLSIQLPIRLPIHLVAGLALGWAGAATAQTAPAERAWTDPPARGAVAPPVARPAPEAPVAAAAKPRAAPRTASRAPKTRVAVARPRPVVAVRTLTPTHPGLRSAPVRIVHAQVPMRSAAPARMRDAAARPVSYGFLAPPPPPGGFDADPRARRIRQAEAAGYLVVRRSTVSGPDGRLLYGYRPYEADDFDD